MSRLSPIRGDIVALLAAGGPQTCIALSARLGVHRKTVASCIKCTRDMFGSNVFYVAGWVVMKGSGGVPLYAHGPGEDVPRPETAPRYVSGDAERVVIRSGYVPAIGEPATPFDYLLGRAPSVYQQARA